MNYPLNMLDLSHTKAKEYLKDTAYYFEIFKALGDIIREISLTLGSDYAEIADGVFAHKSSKIAPTAFIGKNVIIGENTEVRHGAYVRGNALIGDGCVVGNSSEIKNSVLFDGVQVPHFNYVGDSILGYKSHMGAGSVTSNVKSDKGLINVHMCGVIVGTGLKKLGAVLGDYAEIGCNCVLNPGTIIGSHTNVYPLSSVRGEVDSGCIYKGNGTAVKKL